MRLCGELVDHWSEFVGGGTKRRLSATFRRATGGFIADCDARVVSEASDTPTHKESNTRRLALGRLSRLEASGICERLDWIFGWRQYEAMLRVTRSL